MATSDFDTKFQSKVDSVTKNLIAVAKLIVSNPASISEDTIRSLNLIEELVASTGSLATSLYDVSANDSSDLTDPDDLNDEAKAERHATSPASQTVASSGAGS